jgi:uncharacterized protein YbcI
MGNGHWTLYESLKKLWKLQRNKGNEKAKDETRILLARIIGEKSLSFHHKIQIKQNNVNIIVGTKLMFK